MLIHTVRVDSRTFYLEPDQDIPALKARILAAARGGAEFVTFTPRGLGLVSVLVTPVTPVRFEEQERPDEMIAVDEADAPAPDLMWDYGYDFDAA